MAPPPVPERTLRDSSKKVIGGLTSQQLQELKHIPDRIWALAVPAITENNQQMIQSRVPCPDPKLKRSLSIKFIRERKKGKKNL
ncbi:hypothetical protein MMC09_000253, partial [Bachmanniomyces sp. S44760]|nr:hypothetical protein [Bachmanniomyces sp. S44760]